MITDSLIAHQLAVEEAVKLLPPNRAFLFAISCAERQVLTYDKTVAEVPTAPIKDIRPFLDSAWEHVEHGSAIPSGFHLTISSAIPYPEGDDYMSNLLFILGNIYGLLILLENSDIRPCHVSAENNLTLVTNYIHNSLRIPCAVVVNPIVLNHPLVTQEKQRQLNDIDLLQNTDSPIDADRLRRRSTGVDLFGGLWYDSLN